MVAESKKPGGKVKKRVRSAGRGVRETVRQ